jgi:PncC family amidohydrolase
MRKDLAEVAAEVHRVFVRRGLTLSVAESCTGGLLLSLLTGLPGASAFLLAGVVTYSAEAKKTLLSLSADTVERHGVVSDETAREMAEAIRKRTKSDFSLSTTGNLGPDTLEGKEKGLVYIAARKVGKTVSRELRLKGDREGNREDAALEALRLLLALVNNEGE